MPDIAINVIAHAELTARNFVGLRRLFDAEYLDDFGEWDPDMPYGYAPHSVPVIAQSNCEIVDHVGLSRRRVGVGDGEVEIAGVGGVLISDAVRRGRVGSWSMLRSRGRRPAASLSVISAVAKKWSRSTTRAAGPGFLLPSVRSIDKAGRAKTRPGSPC